MTGGGSHFGADHPYGQLLYRDCKQNEPVQQNVKR